MPATSVAVLLLQISGLLYLEYPFVVHPPWNFSFSSRFVQTIVTLFLPFCIAYTNLARRLNKQKNRPAAPLYGPQVDQLLLSPGKGYLMLRMVYSFTPPGVETITRLPSLWPSSALPTGDSLEMSPLLGFASTAPTIV